MRQHWHCRRREAHADILRQRLTRVGTDKAKDTCLANFTPLSPAGQACKRLVTTPPAPYGSGREPRSLSPVPLSWLPHSESRSFAMYRSPMFLASAFALISLTAPAPAQGLARTDVYGDPLPSGALARLG